MEADGSLALVESHWQKQTCSSNDVEEWRAGSLLDRRKFCFSGCEFAEEFLTYQGSRDNCMRYEWLRVGHTLKELYTI